MDANGPQIIFPPINALLPIAAPVEVDAPGNQWDELTGVVDEWMDPSDAQKRIQEEERYSVRIDDLGMPLCLTFPRHMLRPLDVLAPAGGARKLL